MTEELNPVVEPYELDPYHRETDDRTRQSQEAALLENAVDQVENSEQKAQSDRPTDEERFTTDKAVKGGEGDYSWGGFEDQKNNYGPVKPANVSQEDWDNRPKWSRPLEEILHFGTLPAKGLGDFVSDAIGIVPWLKPADTWWDNNSPRYNHPAYKLTRDAASIIIPSMYGGWALNSIGRTATASMQIPNAVRTLGTVSVYTGADTAVAAISSHSKTDDNMAAVLNDWLGWNIPWATRAGDDPDVRYKKNVFEAGMLAGGVELMGAVFSAGRKARLLPRDAFAQEAVAKRQKFYTRYDNPVSASVDSSIDARKAAQTDEMVDALKKDPSGQSGYNAFINDLGEDSVGKAVVNTEPDPLMAKLHQAQIQGNIGTTNGRAAAVAGEPFQKQLMRAINGNERARYLDQLFDSISPNFDAVVANGVKDVRITAEQMNKSIDNLTQATFGRDLNFGEFEAIVDDLKSTVFNASAQLDEASWINYSKALKNAYENMFDPNQVRASAMLVQQSGDTITDVATAAKMLGDDVDTSRQLQIMFEKLNLLDTEMKANQYIMESANQYKNLKRSGNLQATLSWLEKQADSFDDYLKKIRATNDSFTEELWNVAKADPAYFRPLKDVFALTNGDVDQIHKLKNYMDNKLGLLRKGVVDLNPEMPSVIVKGLHAARINSILSGLSAVRAAVGNSLLTAVKPASVMVGARLTGDAAAYKRATYTFGGIMENFRRGWKVMQSEWNFASQFPEEAMMRGRADLKSAQIDKLDELDSMAEIWRRDGEKGKVALYNMAKGLTWWNKQWFVKYGTNALYAIDGFTNSFMASGMARARAYDEVLQSTKGSFDANQFLKKQREIYDQMFDAKGVLTDKAAQMASREIALNLDNQVVNQFERFLDYVPAARGVFLFPRTGANAFELGWSFNPASNIGPAMTRARKTLAATTVQEKAAMLLEHGIDASQNADIAFRTLKSEYIGRQIMGSAVIMGVGAWALEGNITGAGPQDDAERRRMMSIGWKPFSIRNPVTGEWRSYRGLEPFSQLMGLTADIVYQANRVDQSLTEDWFRKASYAITMNVTNGTFISGFEPLAGLISGDPSAWTRFFAQQTDMLAPYKGVRTVLNNVVTPQLKDVENDFFSYLKNSNKFLFSSNEELKDMLDIYTGKPINYVDTPNRIANGLLPVFKTNGGMEPWRQWLLSTGWDGLQRIRRNKFTQQPLSAEDRQYINNWIAKNANLSQQITALMTKNDGWYDQKIKEYQKARGQYSQGDMPIKYLVTHRELDRIHDIAFDAAWTSLENYKAKYTTVGREIYNRNLELQKGQVNKARNTQKKVDQLLKDTRNK